MEKGKKKEKWHTNSKDWRYRLLVWLAWHTGFVGCLFFGHAFRSVDEWNKWSLGDKVNCARCRKLI